MISSIESVWQSGNVYVRSGIAAAVLPVMMFAYQVGTGGNATPNSMYARGDIGYRNPYFDIREVSSAEAASVLTAHDNLQTVFDVLNPTISELARTLGVSRETLYNWKAGGNISDANSEKLSELSRASDLLAQFDRKHVRELVRRRVSGLNFLERVASGQPAIEVANSLLKIIRKEQFQRSILDRTFSANSISLSQIEELDYPHIVEQDDG